MMVVFIWIQTGFAMVIFSAAIKAVPADLLEAARIDGATETQTFWRVTVPSDLPHHRRGGHHPDRHRPEGVRHPQGHDQRQLRHPGARQ